MKKTTKIKSGFRTTIPERVRKKLHLKENDELIWEVEKDAVIVKPLRKNMMDLKNSIHVGKGDVEADIDAARKLKAEENG